MLRERGGSLKARQLRALVLLATGDKNKADDAFSDRIAEELRRNERPEV